MRLETLNLCHNMIKELPPDVTSMRCKFMSCALIVNTKSDPYFTIFISIMIIVFSGSVKNVRRQLQSIGDITTIR